MMAMALNNEIICTRIYVADGLFIPQVNINEHINWPGRAEWVTGRTYAHELGHNLGMQ